jgi:hypothetical protein
MPASPTARPLLSETLSKKTIATCNDCYFRQEGLCALPGNTPCPTFRAATRDGLQPPTHPRLVLRELAEPPLAGTRA